MGYHGKKKKKPKVLLFQAMSFEDRATRKLSEFLGGIDFVWGLLWYPIFLFVLLISYFVPVFLFCKIFQFSYFTLFDHLSLSSEAKRRFSSRPLRK